jgi:hypothetical protein
MGKDISLFDGSNFHLWKSTMMDVLVSKDLGHTLLPPTGKEKDYECDSRKALAKIRLSVDTKFLQPLLKCNTALEAMDILAADFEPRSFVRWTTLFRQLASLKLIEGGDLKTHFNLFDSIATQLGDCRKKMDEDYQAAFLTLSLSESYQPIVSMVSTVGGDKIDLRKLRASLLLEEQKCLAVAAPSSSSPFPLASSSKDSALLANARPRCVHCGRTNHPSDKCWQKFGYPPGVTPPPASKDSTPKSASKGDK